MGKKSKLFLQVVRFIRVIFCGDQLIFGLRKVFLGRNRISELRLELEETKISCCLMKHSFLFRNEQIFQRDFSNEFSNFKGQ